MNRQLRKHTNHLWAFLLIAAAALTGCGRSASTGSEATPERPASSPESLSDQAANNRSTRPFDFYLFNLSWSPEYCHSHPGSAECAEHPGFVVHGLWPQNSDGSYPRNCGTAPGPTSDEVWRGLLPTGELAQHEWEAHGVCTGLAPNAYFGLIRRARAAVQIPPAFVAPTQPRGETPDQIVAQFEQVNAGIPAAAFALSCGNNYLTAIEVCFDKSLRAIACSNVRSCRANYVKIAPIQPTDR